MKLDDLQKFPENYQISDFLEKAAWFTYHGLIETETLEDIGQNIAIGLVNNMDVGSAPVDDDSADVTFEDDNPSQEVSNARVVVKGPTSFVEHVIKAADDYVKAASKE